MSYEVFIGNCMDSLKKMADESVDCCVTSPPYWGLRDYGGGGIVWGGEEECNHDWEGFTRPSENTRNNDNSLQLKSAYWTPQEQAFCTKCDAWFGQLGLEPTPQQYVKNMVLIFEEVRRILKPQGTLWLNLGDSYCGTGHKGTEMKDKKHPEGRNGQVFAVNKKIDGLKRKDMVGIPWRTAFALQEAGWWLRQDIIWAKPSCMPEPVKDRCTKSHEYIFLFAKSEKYFFDHLAIKEPIGHHMERRIERGSTIVPSNKHTQEARMGKPESNQMFAKESTLQQIAANGRNKRDVWWVSPKPYPEAHFAVYPPDLIEPCILAGTSAKGCCSKCGKPYVRITEGAEHDHVDFSDRNEKTGVGHRHRKIGQKYANWRKKNSHRTVGWEATCECDADVVPSVVLDPFGGSGTTAGVAIKHGRKAILCELNEEYASLIPSRIESISQIQKETMNDTREWL